MAKVQMMVRVEYRDGWWLVLVPSPVCGWIVQGEWKTEAEAKADARSWLR